MAGEFGNRRPLDSNMRAINVQILIQSTIQQSYFWTQTENFSQEDVYEDVYLQDV